jgi:hypothetical protein
MTRVLSDADPLPHFAPQRAVRPQLRRDVARRGEEEEMSTRPLAKTLDLTIAIGGAAGQGIATPGNILAKIFARRGLHLYS